MSVTVWRYHLPSEKGEGWAIAFMDSIGCFSVLSDYGDYGYRWPERGWSSPDERDFRQFFMRTDDEYVLRKIARSDHYDGQATYKNIKRQILELRRSGSWNKDRAREEWNLLQKYDRVECREMFAWWYDHTRIDGAHECAIHDFSPQAIGFKKHVLPRLREAIKTELAAEGLAA